MNRISGMGESAARLRESIQERLRAGRAERLTQAAVGILAGGAAGGAAADPAGVAAVRGHEEAREVEHHGEGHEAHEVERHGAGHAEAHHEDHAQRLGHLEVAIGIPGEVADPAGLAQATAVRGAAAYRRAREAAEVHAASPGITVAA